MPVDVEKQGSFLGSPIVWFLLMACVAGGIWYGTSGRKILADKPVVAEAKPEVVPEAKPEVAPDFIAPPAPVVEAEPEVFMVRDETLLEVDRPPAAETPKAPDVPYKLYPNARVVKPRLGKGPDGLDQEMWEINATPSKPYKWSAQIGAKLGPRIQQYLAKPARETVAHPNAKDFPGAVPEDAPRISRAVKIPLNRPRWNFTGLYAPPGEVIRIQTSRELIGATVIIGCHRDNIAASKRVQTHRFPIISNSHKLEKNAIEVSNPFGGMIYIDVPGKAEWEKTRATCRVEISGAVEAPHFVLGETTPAEWNRIRKAPAPWGELGGVNHIGAARSARFRDMEFETAKELAEYWDEAVRLQDWLCGWPKRRSPERMVPDAEITVGAGHSGYPYMGYLDWEGWVDLDSITTRGSWGHFHEIGHNHQSGAWTFAGYGEVTNNVMALLCSEKLAGVKLGDDRSWLGNLDGALATRLGPPPKETPGGNLAMYVPVIQAFGWESLRNTWSEYAKRAGRTSMNLSTDDKKKEQFVLIWSKHAKANLGPYFEMFGFPYTPSMRTRLSTYRRWMPANFPPKKPEGYVEGGEIEDHGAQLGDFVMD